MDADLADVVRARYPALLRRAYLLVGSGPAAEHLVQEALAKTVAAGKRRTIDNFDAYLLTAMTHLAISRWRARRHTKEDLTPVPRDIAGPDDAQLRADRDHMWQLLQQLAPRQRAVLVLRYYEDLDERQIADLLGIGVGTVRSSGARGLARLRAAVQADKASVNQ